MRTDESLTEEIMLLFKERMNVAVPSSRDDLFDEGILDSLLFAELVVYLEEKFGLRVTLEDLEIENFRTVGNIARWVSRSLGDVVEGSA